MAFSQYNHVYLIDFASGRAGFRKAYSQPAPIVVFVSADIAIHEIIR